MKEIIHWTNLLSLLFILPFPQFSTLDAIVSLKQAVEILTDHGRFHAAANQMRDIAQIYEADLSDISQAMQSYETAADWFNGEEAVS